MCKEKFKLLSWKEHKECMSQSSLCIFSDTSNIICKVSLGCMPTRRTAEMSESWRSAKSTKVSTKNPGWHLCSYIAQHWWGLPSRCIPNPPMAGIFSSATSYWGDGRSHRYRHSAVTIQSWEQTSGSSRLVDHLFQLGNNGISGSWWEWRNL